MIDVKPNNRQGGVALVISLLFLLVVTIISVTAARNSSLSVKMTSNVQDLNNSRQSAEAAIYAVLGMIGTANDPLTNDDVIDPFEDFDPLDGELNDPNTPATRVLLVRADVQCQRSGAGVGGTSASQNQCSYYRIDATHDVPGRARTETSLGVVRTLLSLN